MYNQNGGRCGICGNAFNESPREHEAGGRYAKGTIVATYKTGIGCDHWAYLCILKYCIRYYTVGELIEVTFNSTANHNGFVNFTLCPNNNVNRAATEDCFNRFVCNFEMNPSINFTVWFASNPLEIVGSARVNDNYNYELPNWDNQKYHEATVKVQLPRDLECRNQCILRVWNQYRLLIV